ncbi:hypothetical protein [Salinisphaera sp. T31B1]|uniref:hypothetical protein n=1 Tax=Salinisphaera sp. T31B1 TaxID=727963 RepID=UPI00333E3DEA
MHWRIAGPGAGRHPSAVAAVGRMHAPPDQRFAGQILDQLRDAALVPAHAPGNVLADTGLEHKDMRYGESDIRSGPSGGVQQAMQGLTDGRCAAREPPVANVNQTPAYQSILSLTMTTRWCLPGARQAYPAC